MENKMSFSNKVEIAEKKEHWIVKARKQKMLLLFLLPGIVFFALFNYLPLYGLVGAFQIYDPIDGFFGSEWVGFENFQLLFSLPQFYDVLLNTLTLGVIMLVFGFPAPIILALILNEVIGNKFKRVVQSVSYLPHFISWVIAAGLWYKMLAADGPLNDAMIQLRLIEEPIYYFNSESYFYFIAVLSGIWKEIGWGSIIYLAALTSINPVLYESAEIDGASRWQQIRYITLPGMAPTIVLLFVLAMTNILNVSFDQMWTLQNPANLGVSDVLDTYVFTILLQGAASDYSIGIAIGLMKAVIGLTLFFVTNGIMKRMGFGSLI